MFTMIGMSLLQGKEKPEFLHIQTFLELTKYR